MRRWHRGVEFLVLFGVAPWALARAPRWAVLPGIVGGGLLCLILLLRDESFDRATLGWRAAKPLVTGGVARRAGAMLAMIIAAVWLRDEPGKWLNWPRQRPGLWLALMVGYPVLSVYPQEVMFRAFIFHRYRALLATPAARVMCSAAAFAFAHVVLHNTFAILATAVAGLALGLAYERRRSVVAVSLEHALWGCMAFTIGLGVVFYAGARVGRGCVRASRFLTACLHRRGHRPRPSHRRCGFPSTSCVLRRNRSRS